MLLFFAQLSSCLLLLLVLSVQLLWNSFCFLLIFFISVISSGSARVLVDFCPVILHCCCCFCSSFCSSSSFLSLLLNLKAPLLFLLSAHLPSFLSLLLALAAPLLLLLFPHLLLIMSLLLALQAPLLLLLFTAAPFSPLLLALLAPLLVDVCPGCATVVAFAVSVCLFLPSKQKTLSGCRPNIRAILGEHFVSAGTIHTSHSKYWT